MGDRVGEVSECKMVIRRRPSVYSVLDPIGLQTGTHFHFLSPSSGPGTNTSLSRHLLGQTRRFPVVTIRPRNHSLSLSLSLAYIPLFLKRKVIDIQDW